MEGKRSRGGDRAAGEGGGEGGKERRGDGGEATEEFGEMMYVRFKPVRK